MQIRWIPYLLLIHYGFSLAQCNQFWFVVEFPVNHVPQQINTLYLQWISIYNKKITFFQWLIARPVDFKGSQREHDSSCTYYTHWDYRCLSPLLCSFLIQHNCYRNIWDPASELKLASWKVCNLKYIFFYRLTHFHFWIW